jgi:adenine phosphoribosyltransferase
MHCHWLCETAIEGQLVMQRNPSLDLGKFIRNVPDFPKPGILFKDITPLLGNKDAFRETIARMADPFRGKGIDSLVAAEARGFIFAAPLAIELGAAFVPVRKPGKLPYEKHSFSYDLEYGSDTLEMHKDAVVAGQRVLVVDDLLATGGTVEACCKLLSNIQVEIVGCLFCIELIGLNGRARLAPYNVVSLLSY